MLIKLKEIPEEGKEFIYNNFENPEMAEHLSDLITGHPFDIKVNVKHFGNTYDVSGNLKTTITCQCSRCGNDFEFPIKETFHETLIVGKSRDVNGVFSDSLSPQIASGWEFHAGEYAHEVIAISEPNQPLCKEDCKGLCLQCGTDLNIEKCGCAQGQEQKKSPFSVLKNLKLN